MFHSVRKIMFIITVISGLFSLSYCGEKPETEKAAETVETETSSPGAESVTTADKENNSESGAESATEKTIESKAASEPQSEPPYRIGGTIQGLTSGEVGIVNVRGRSGMGNRQRVMIKAGSGSWQMPEEVADKTGYSIEIPQSAQGHRCRVQNAHGRVKGADVNDIHINCDKLYSIKGTVSGMSEPYQYVSIRTSESPVRSTTVQGKKTSFSLHSIRAEGEKYKVVIDSQMGVKCSVSNGSGTMPAADVTGVKVSCVKDNTGM